MRKQFGTLFLRDASMTVTETFDLSEEFQFPDETQCTDRMIVSWKCRAT
jgi:hypothetical protein